MTDEASRYKMVLTVDLAGVPARARTDQAIAAQLGARLLELWDNSEKAEHVAFDMGGGTVQLTSHGELLHGELAVLLVEDHRLSRPEKASEGLLAYGLRALKMEADDRAGGEPFR
jgi:hypothetical protein